MVDMIIGRERELAALERALARVPEGPIAFLIEGEAGIGKTSLWQEGIRLAQARSYRILRCRPGEAETTLSYAALSDLLAPVTDKELDVLADVQRHALEVALLRTDDAVPAEPRAIAAGLATLIVHLAAQVPTIVAVDDVQWLDAASARVLQFAFRRLPPSLGLLLARRTTLGQDAPPLGLDRSLASEALERIVPAAISLAELQQLLAGRLEVRFSRPTLVRLHELSAGNPFYAIEIGRELTRQGGEPGLGEPLPVPSTIQELLNTRIGALSPAVRRALLFSSALARPTVSVIEAGLDRKRESTSDLLEAEEAGVIEVHQDGSIQFTHPLIASTIYASVGEERHRTVHRRLAEVATEEEERARHLALSMIGVDEVAADALESAAQGAGRRGAQEAAAELLEHARRLTPPGRPEARARRSLAEASALLAAGDIGRAHALAQEVADTAPAGPLRAEGLLLLGRIAHVDRSSREAAEHLEEAILQAGEDRRLRGRIHSLLAWMSDTNQGRAARHAEAAIELLDSEEEPGALAFALMTKFYNDAQPGEGADRRLLERGLELEGRAISLVDRSIHPLIWFKSMDEFDAARERYRVEADWALSRGDESWGAERLGQLAEVELRAGNTTLAERYVEQSAAVMEQVGPDGPLAMPLRIRAMVDAHCGRIDRARSTLTPLINEFERAGDLWWAALCLSTLGFVEVTTGTYGACDQALTRMTEHLETAGVRDALAQRSEPDQIEAVAALGEPERARAILARLEERNRYLPRKWITVALPRCRMLTLAACGDLPAALAAGGDEQVKEADELPFELARNLLVRGQLHRRTKQKRAAGEDLRRAVEIFTRVGAVLWAVRAQAELERVGLRASAPDELTPSERRVAELAATGLTNRQVAETAFISPKTVEANLTRAYRKLGIHSRAELGARMGIRSER